MLGAITFLAVAWLAFDALKLRHDFLTASRGIGFLLLAVWQVWHAFQISSVSWGYAGYGIYILGVIFILWNLFLEKPIARPEFKAILILPPLAAAAWWANIFAAAGLVLITLLSYRQYNYELKKTLKPFWMGFALFSVAAVLGIFYATDDLEFGWMLEHILKLAGFLMLGRWVWKYLELRIREEMLLIFLSFAFIMAVIVSLTFSTILMGRIEESTKSGLRIDAKVMELALWRAQEEAFAKARLLAADPEIVSAALRNDFEALERILEKKMRDEKLGFLLVTSKEGEVMLRTHALSQKDDDLSREFAVGSALQGEAAVSIESSPAEKFSIRAAAPILDKSRVAGAVVAGFLLDNAFADGMRRVTGLDMTIFDGDVRAATTLFGPDGRTRGTGLTETNTAVLDKVLRGGEELTLRTFIFSRPYLASYIPLRNSEGLAVGMIEVVAPQREILETAASTNRLTLVVVSIIMLILMAPIYIITKRLSGEVK